MSFGALFTLRPRARKSHPASAGEPYPAAAGWDERRAAEQPGCRPQGPQRRAGDRQPAQKAPR